MTQPGDPTSAPLGDDDAALEQAWNEARNRFVAGFPKRSDSIGYLLALVSTFGAQGPVTALHEIVHKTAGLAGTIGFPTVSTHARELEDLLDALPAGTLDVSLANRTFEAMEDGFTDDLATPPVWAEPANKIDRPRRVTVVEDDEDQREVLGIHLRSAGYDIVNVETGDLAIASVREHRPDIILLDANLPGLDGYDVCRLLKLDPDLADIPVIFMTVRASADDRIAGLILGADDYLVKPVDMGELTLRMQLLLNRKASEKSSSKTFALPDEGKELDFESFTALARQLLSEHPAVLALIRLPESRLNESYTTLRMESRRRDLVACYGPGHIILMLVGMPADKAAERVTFMVKRLGPGTPPKFHVGVAISAEPGQKMFETLLTEADEAVVAARHHGILVAVAGQDMAVSDEPRRKGTIVMADDDEEVTRLVAAQLRSANYEIFTAADGSLGLAAIEKHHPDLVIVDLMMPRMTGFDVLAKMRAMAARPRAIVLSSRGREQDVTRAFALGADDYMTKPFSPQELLARIERLLR